MYPSKVAMNEPIHIATMDKVMIPSHSHEVAQIPLAPWPCRFNHSASWMKPGSHGGPTTKASVSSSTIPFPHNQTCIGFPPNTGEGMESLPIRAHIISHTRKSMTLPPTQSVRKHSHPWPAQPIQHYCIP